jgi:hypothetical protein
MPLDREAQEFNEKQKRLQEYYQTEGRGLSRVEDELRKVNISLGYLIDTLLQWIEDEAKRREDEHRRSTYGMWDPLKNRTQRGEYRPIYGEYGYPRNEPWKSTPVAPYDPERDPDRDRDSFDEGVGDGKEEEEN